MDEHKKYNPLIHHRRSIRLKDYDYSSDGLYFITICCKDRIHLFGQIENCKMILNRYGQIAETCWLEIPQHFPNVILHEFIIMPNHVHGIIEIAPVGTNNYSSRQQIPTRANNNSPQQQTPTRANNNSPQQQTPVRANDDSPQQQTPVRANDDSPQQQTPVRANDDSPQQQTPTRANDDSPQQQTPTRANDDSPQQQTPTRANDDSPQQGTSKTIGSIVRGFKIGVTKWMRQNTDIYNIWQRNYYEHIIRNQQSYQNISNYIINNPANWQQDKFY